MQEYEITSDTSPIPLAYVRSDGNKVEFIVDNTQGMLPRSIRGSHQRMMQMIRGSTHLKIHQPKQATTNLIRYVLDNGDVVEITSDGQTCQLNGQLLDLQQKQALFAAIKRGDLKVARRANEPVPVIPTPQPNGGQIKVQPVEVGHRTADVVQELADLHRHQQQAEQQYGAHSDPAIESRDYDYSDDPAFSRCIARYATYGST